MHKCSKTVAATLTRITAALFAAAFVSSCDVGAGRGTDTIVRTDAAATQAVALSDDAVRYTVTDIGTLGGDEAFPNGVDDAGWITGYSRTADNATHAFRWGDGRMIDLGSLNGADSVGWGVNARGHVVGLTNNAAQQNIAFLRAGGTMTELPPLLPPPPPGIFEVSRATDINDRGDVAGYSIVFEPSMGWYVPHATIWRDGAPIHLGTIKEGLYSEAVKINNDGWVMGFGDTTPAGRWQGFVWRDGVKSLIGLPGGTGSFPAAMNKFGHVVGSADTGAGTGDDHAVLFRDGQTIDLGTLGGRYSQAYGINDRDEVVGMSATADGYVHAFLWRNGRMIDLGTLGDDFVNSFALAINNRGQIAGFSQSSFGEQRPVLWQNGRTIALPHIDAPGYLDLTDVRFITDDGLIVGNVMRVTDPENGTTVQRTLVWQAVRERAGN